MLGGRYFHQEISACLDALKRTEIRPRGSSSSVPVRKLTRRFDPFLWRAMNRRFRKCPRTSRPSKTFSSTSRPGTSFRPAAKLEKLADSVLTSARKVLDGVNLDVNSGVTDQEGVLLGPPRGRRARKIVILENADRMLDSAKNALLKISRNRRPTSPSSCSPPGGERSCPPYSRAYGPIRSGSAIPRRSREVLERIFRETSVGFADLREYFLVFQDMNPQTLRNAALAFLRSSLSPKGGFFRLLGCPSPRTVRSFPTGGNSGFPPGASFGVPRIPPRRSPAEELAGVPLERFEDGPGLVRKPPSPRRAQPQSWPSGPEAPTLSSGGRP